MEPVNEAPGATEMTHHSRVFMCNASDGNDRVELASRMIVTSVDVTVNEKSETEDCGNSSIRRTAWEQRASAFGDIRQIRRGVGSVDREMSRCWM